MQPRVVIVHCHIFKNAGSSFDWSLHRQFQNNFIDHRDDQAMINQSDYLKNFLLRKQNISALSSHHIRLPLPSIEGCRLMAATFLRHPIDRVASVYRFERKQRADTPGAINAKKLAFRDYILWRMRPDVGGTIRNHQTRYCSGNLGSRLTEGHFAKAVEHIEKNLLLGIVERYDESMVIFEEILRPHFQAIDLSFIRQNVSLEKKDEIKNRVKRTFGEIGSDAADQLKRNNELDQCLYSSAMALLESRIAEIGDFSKKLENSKERCLRLRKLQK